MLLSEEEENEIREFISSIRPIELISDHEISAMRWGHSKVKSFIH